VDTAAAPQRQENNRYGPPLREESIVAAANDLVVAFVVAAAVVEAAAVELAAAAAVVVVAAAVGPAAAFAAAAAAAAAVGTLPDSIVYHRPVESRTEVREAPRDTVRAQAMLRRAGDRFHYPRREDHRPAVGFPTKRNPVVAVVVVVAVAGTIRHPGEIPAPGPIDPGVSPYYLCTIRRARQYLKVDNAEESLRLDTY